MSATHRIRIDLNSRTREGLVPASFAGEAFIGQPVIAFEPEDGVAAFATIAQISERAELVYLDVDWSSLDDDQAARPAIKLGVTRPSSGAIGPGGRRSRGTSWVGSRGVRIGQSWTNSANMRAAA